MASRAMRTLQPCLLRQGYAQHASLPRASSSAVLLLHTSATRGARAYLPIEDEGHDPRLGDYENPPFESRQTRRYDPRWWDKQEKANFGETLHEQDDIAGVFGPDLPRTDPRSAAKQLLVAFSLMGAFCGLIYVTTPQKPGLPRTFPRDGLKEELGGVAAPAYGAFDAKTEDEDEEEDEDDE